MKAAVYARFSTEKQHGASLDDQQRVCERMCDVHGFAVVAVYRDAAISGGTSERPGYQNMLAAARRHEFEVIVAEDTSRLWRLLAEQAPRLAELCDLGVHVVTHDLDTRQESSAILGPVSGAMAEQYRKEIGRRTRRGLEGLARLQKPTGGRAYGYIVRGGRREIEPEQAEVIRRIFQMYADGASARTIASRLNAEHIPSPGAAWNRISRRRTGWLASAIAGDLSRGLGILNNDFYRGFVIWNRSRWIRSAQNSKKRRQITNPRSEWIEHRDESLRIVPDALWNAVKARQQEQSRRLGVRVRDGLKNAPGAGRPPRYVFSGWLRCGDCGSGLTLVNSRSYACAGHVYGRACGNTTYYRRAELEQGLLAGIKHDLVRPEVIAEVERRVRRMVNKRPKVDGRRIAQLRQEVHNLVEAAASGALRNSPAIGQRLAAAEAELARLETEQSRAVSTVSLAAIVPRIAEHYRAVVAKLEKLDDVERIQAELRSVIGPEIIVQRPRNGEIVAQASGNETPLAARAGEAAEIMVAGAGFEPATFGL